MVSIKLVVESDENTNKYIPILRKVTSKPISEIKKSIETKEPLMIKESYDIDGLISLESTAEKLMSMGAMLTIYQHNRIVSLEMIKNLIERNKEIEKDIEELDDLMFGDE
ncbi:hypothetical protein H9I32_04995 [Bacillus sp. Xin]|uniref:hypothetical protein n=1 Tax=unclassified Bacillus (in: firmicutes) TaxID=185979 RepID=UPI00157400ED|nr:MULTISPECIES: hypothetical protein [unclassified Bacillus (in: firmicutes)]MBC6971802.1 hypothetical protein [Bacillus sp. Xin]NSW37951.1 hypothetical protein [Bacillus sp. Xin1]